MKCFPRKSQVLSKRPYRTYLVGIMDTRYSRDTLPQSQNSSQNSTPQLGSHSHPYGDASSASLLRNHEHGQYEHGKSQKLKRATRGFSFCVEVILCFLVSGFSGISFHAPTFEHLNLENASNILDLVKTYLNISVCCSGILDERPPHRYQARILDRASNENCT